MEKASYVIYVTILILSVILFGAMHTYVYTLMSLGILLAALFLLFKSIWKDRRKGGYEVRIQKTGLHLFFGVMLAFLVFQLIPLPPFLMQLLSPEAGVVWQKSLSARGLGGGDNIAGGWHSLAAYGYPVRMSIIRWGVYGLFFFGLVRVLDSRKRIQFLVYLLLSLGCFEALYGLIQAYSGDAHVLWKSVGARKSASGTYINRNHFAGFMEMGMLLAAGFAISLMDRKKENKSGRNRKTSLKARLSAFLSDDQRVQKRILILFAGVVMGLGVVFSASRGGIVAAAGGLLCMGLFLAFKKGQKRSGVVLLVLFFITSAYSLDIGIDYVTGRFGGIEKSYEQRARMANRALVMFGDYKMAGVGVGNFQYAYPRYQAEEELKGYVRFAHNDWAQFLSEAGITGFVILLVGLVFYGYGTIRLWRKRGDPFAVGLGIVPISVMVAIGIHSFSDFNLHIPANFLILVAIMAIGYAALHSEDHHRRERTYYRHYRLPLKYRGGVVLVLVLGLIGWSGYWSVRHFMGEVYCHTVPNTTFHRDMHPAVGEVLGAISWDSGNAGYWFKLEGVGTDFTDFTDGKGKGKTGWLDEWMEDEDVSGVNPGKLRIMALERAVALNPFDAQYHVGLGWEYAHKWEEKDYHSRWLPAADISMGRAAYFAGVKNPHLHQELGNYWAMRSKSVLPNNPLHHEAWAKAVWHYQKAQHLEKGAAQKRMKKEIKAYVWNFYPDEDMVGQTLKAK